MPLTCLLLITFSPLLDSSYSDEISNLLFTLSINCLSEKQSSQRQRGRCGSLDSIKRKIPFFYFTRMNHSWRQDKNCCLGTKENMTVLFDKEGNFLKTLRADSLISIGHCLLRFSYLILVFSAGPLFRSPCELLPVGVGHPVQATLKSFTALSGCASGGTRSLPQEVHVINLRSRPADLLRSTPAEVSCLERQDGCNVCKYLLIKIH